MVYTNPNLVGTRTGVEPSDSGELVPSLSTTSPSGSSGRYKLSILPGLPIEQQLLDLSRLHASGCSTRAQLDALAVETLRVGRTLFAWQRGYHAFKHERRVVYLGKA